MEPTFEELKDDELRELYAWVDSVPLSRPKRNFTRDFADGVMAAELVKFVVPKLVDLHNYPPANSVQQKIVNWNTLNHKVLKKLGLMLPEEAIQAIVRNRTGVVESVLYEIRKALETFSNIPDYEEKEIKHVASKYPSHATAPQMRRNQSHPKNINNNHFTNNNHQVKNDHSVSNDEKDLMVLELQETVQILQLKIHKLEQLINLKDKMIEDLQRSR